MPNVIGVTVMAEFGKRLKQLRTRAKMTQEQLARAANISTSSVSKLEQLDQDPSWSTVQALARAMGISCEAFNTLDPEPVESPEAAPGQASEKPPAKKGGKRK
jgi:transcriptional regulator with XRE-family HTH domain